MTSLPPQQPPRIAKATITYWRHLSFFWPTGLNPLPYETELCNMAHKQGHIDLQYSSLVFG